MACFRLFGMIFVSSFSRDRAYRTYLHLARFWLFGMFSVLSFFEIGPTEHNFIWPDLIFLTCLSLSFFSFFLIQFFLMIYRRNQRYYKRRKQNQLCSIPDVTIAISEDSDDQSTDNFLDPIFLSIFHFNSWKINFEFWIKNVKGQACLLQTLLQMLIGIERQQRQSMSDVPKG